MKNEWLSLVMRSCHTPATFYSGSRKILRPVTATFTNIRDDLQLTDIGYTKAKMRQLQKNYIHDESRSAAVQMWQDRLSRESYGSVGFHCFNHYVKGHAGMSYWERYNTEKNPNVDRGLTPSVMGPCITSVTITLLPNGRQSVGLHYRTTELFKKFPADLVFIRDELLSPFNLTDVESWTFHFDNVTAHPMYWGTVLPLLQSPVREFERMKKRDPKFWRVTTKWTAKYLLDDHLDGIKKFRQAMAVRASVRKMLSPETMSLLQTYIRGSLS